MAERQSKQYGKSCLFLVQAAQSTIQANLTILGCMDVTRVGAFMGYGCYADVASQALGPENC
jgi:hypothetical protein